MPQAVVAETSFSFVAGISKLVPKPLELKARQREHDAKRRVEKPWRAWYGTARWKALRKYQLRAEPHCRMCAKRGQTTPATVADHIEPHRGNPDLFWSPANLQSLCQPCHDGDKARIEKGGRPRQVVDADGWPIG